MVLGRLVATAIVVGAAAATMLPAQAATHRHRHATRAITVTRSRGLPVPEYPYVAETPNFTGRNGKTTDVNVFPDASIGDGFYGFQTPGLDAYGFAGGGLTPYQLQ